MHNDSPDHSPTRSRDRPEAACAANRITAAFYRSLSSIPVGTDAWLQLIDSTLKNGNPIERILCYVEIGKSGCAHLLGQLRQQAAVEKDPTVLAAIYSAIGTLGGFREERNPAEYFTDCDVGRRSAAMMIVFFLPDHEAIQILKRVLDTDSDASLRFCSAVRLSYLHCRDGMPLLRSSLPADRFLDRIQAACALAFLGDPDGTAYVRAVLDSYCGLEAIEKSNALFTFLELRRHVQGHCHSSNSDRQECIDVIVAEVTSWLSSWLAASGRFGSTEDGTASRVPMEVERVALGCLQPVPSVAEPPPE